MQKYINELRNQGYSVSLGPHGQVFVSGNGTQMKSFDNKAQLLNAFEFLKKKELEFKVLFPKKLKGTYNHEFARGSIKRNYEIIGVDFKGKFIILLDENEILNNSNESLYNLIIKKSNIK